MSILLFQWEVYFGGRKRVSFKTVMNKAGVRLKQYLLIILSCPYMVVFFFSFLQMQSHRPWALLVLSSCHGLSCKSRKRTVWKEITGRLLNHFVLGWGQGEKGGDAMENYMLWVCYGVVENDCHLLFECAPLQAAAMAGWGPHTCPRTHTHSSLSPLLPSWVVEGRHEPDQGKSTVQKYLSFANTFSLLVLITVVGDT